MEASHFFAKRCHGMLRSAAHQIRVTSFFIFANSPKNHLNVICVQFMWIQRMTIISSFFCSFEINKWQMFNRSPRLRSSALPICISLFSPFSHLRLPSINFLKIIFHSISLKSRRAPQRTDRTLRVDVWLSANKLILNKNSAFSINARN